jgi:CelD/BcsL family acetyltransferase involved in cellulose biosynthesis
MNIEFIEHPDEMQSLAHEWNALAGASRTPLLTYEWFSACARAASPSAQIAVAVSRSGNKITAIAPLVSIRKYGIPTLVMLGDPYCKLYETKDFLFKDTSSLRSLIDALFSLRRPILLGRIPAESQTVSLLKEGRRGFVTMSMPNTDRSLFVPRTGSWTTFESRMSKSRRDNLKRKTKAAMKIGETTFETVRPTPETYLAYLDEFVAMEAAGWKGQDGGAVLQNAHQRRFWALYLESLASRNQFVVFIMRIAGKAVAIRLAAEYAGRLWELKITYDEEYRRCSPGVLLTHETIRYVFEQGLEAHEFLGHEEEWERTWTDEFHEYLTFQTVPLSVTGMLALGPFVARYAAARARIA